MDPLRGQFKRGLRLRIRLLLLILLALLPSLALLMQTAIEERRVIATSVEDGVLRLVRPVTSELDRLLGGAKQLLVVLARLPEVRAHEPRAARALFADLQSRNPLYANIAAVRPDGTVFASAVPLSDSLSPKIQDRPYFRRAVATKNFAVSMFQIDRSTNKASINVAYPALGPQGEVEAVVIAALDLSYFERYAAVLGLPPGSVLLLIDRGGVVLARFPRDIEALGTNLKGVPLVREILTRQYGVLEASGLDGVERIYAFAPVGDEPRGAPAYLAIGIRHQVAYGEADAMLLRNLGLLGLVWAILLGIVWFGSDRILLRQVDRLMRATRRLAAGDLDARVGAPYNGDELGELAVSLDTMAANIQALTAQREKAVREEQAAQAEAAALKNLDRLRTQFVNAVSHELRIPLTTIIGYVEFLEDELGGPLTDRQAEFVGQVRQGAVRLARLVDDLLDFARIEAGTFSLRVETTDFGAKVLDILESFRPQAEETEVTIAADLPPEPLAIPMDSHRIGQVLSNLIGNAIKFTPPGGKITITVRADGRHVYCEVRDTGAGIPHDEFAKLFKPFSQLPAGKKLGGTGLGLSITKSLVEAHGGKVGIRSKLGEGSTFWFSLPRERQEIDGDRHYETASHEMPTEAPSLRGVNKRT